MSECLLFLIVSVLSCSTLRRWIGSLKGRDGPWNDLWIYSLAARSNWEEEKKLSSTDIIPVLNRIWTSRKWFFWIQIMSVEGEVLRPGESDIYSLWSRIWCHEIRAYWTQHNSRIRAGKHGIYRVVISAHAMFVSDTWHVCYSHMLSLHSMCFCYRYMTFLL